MAPLAETELQTSWFAGAFGTLFFTTNAVPVRIVRFGEWNREAGPDFVHAAVSFDGAPALEGAIELDWNARDWERHGHGLNSNYEQVILHLFFQTGVPAFFTRTLSGRNVAQVQLNPGQRATEAKPLLPLAFAKCNEREASELIERAARLRLERKAAALARLSAHHGSDEALYQAVAAALGYKANKLPFTLLAQRLPLRRLLADKDAAEAMLLGVAGFLNVTDLRGFETETRGYLRALWEKWWPIQGEFQHLQLGAGQWRWSGIRPNNHPHRRLGALAEIVKQWPKVRMIARSCEIAGVEDFFAGLSSPYWNHHYTLQAARTVRPMALVGNARVADILANVLFPYALWRQPKLWNVYKELEAPLENRSVENAAACLFGAARPELGGKIVGQQGLLELYGRFCLGEGEKEPGLMIEE